MANELLGLRTFAPAAQDKFLMNPQISTRSERGLRQGREILFATMAFNAVLWSHASLASGEAADSPRVPASVEPRLTITSESHWYGWEVLLAGETGAVLLATALETRHSSIQAYRTLLLYPFGLTAYVAGGPILHMSHGNYLPGLISLGLNITVPITAGLIGGAAACSQDGAGPACRGNGFFDWAAVSVLVVPIFDAAFLAWEDIPLEQTLTLHSRSKQQLWPFVGETNGTAVWGICGIF